MMRFTRAAIAALLLSATAAGSVLAGEPLRFCSAESELPYSDRDGKGFENRLAAILAEELGRPVENVWWQDPRYFVRDMLDRDLCDVVVGVDSGDPRLLTSEPYYRSGYVFIYRKTNGLQVDSFDSDFVRKAKQIAFMPETPAEILLRKVGRYNDQFNYLQSLIGFKARRNQYVRYDPEKLVKEVESGNADLAILWGPQAARYVKAAGNTLEMRLIPDNQTRADGERVPFHYSTSFGVKKDNKALMAEIDKALKKRMSDIQAVLKDEGMPLISLKAATNAKSRPARSHG